MRVQIFVRFALILRVLSLGQQDHYYYDYYNDADEDQAYHDYLTSNVPQDFDIGQDYEVCIFYCICFSLDIYCFTLIIKVFDSETL